MSLRETRCVLLGAASRTDMLGMLDSLAAGEANLPSGSPEHPVRASLVGSATDLPGQAIRARIRLAAHDGERLNIRSLGFHYGEGLAPGKVAFLFPGEGSQRIGMLREARDVLPPVAAWLDAIDAVHLASGQAPPSRLIHPPSGLEPGDLAALDERLFDIGYGGQITTVANLALFEVLGQLGIAADAMLGHSNGEHSAAVAACMRPETERLELCTWLRDVSAAGRTLPAPDPPQAMFAVGGAKPKALREAVQAAGAFVAMDNCPNQQVVAGADDRVGSAVARLTSAGAVCGRLPFARAYHTPLFGDWARVLARHYGQLLLGPARTPLWSCLTAAPVGLDPDSVRAAMIGQWTAPVRLRETIEGLYREGFRTFVEVGCDDKLSAFVQDTLRGRPHLATATLSARQGEVQQFHRMLAQLHAQGLWIDPVKVRALVGGGDALGAIRPPVRLGGLASTEAAIARQERLITAARDNLARIDAALGNRPAPPAATAPGGALLGFGQSERVGRTRLLRRFTSKGDPLLRDHALGRQRTALPVLSFTTSLVIAAEAARSMTRGTGIAILERLSAERWLALYDGALDLAVDCTPVPGGTAVTLEEGATRAFSARVRFAPAPLEAAPAPGLRGGRAPSRWTAERFYRDYAFHGPAFRGLRRVSEVSAEGIRGEAVATELHGLRREDLEGDPALLDIACQLVAVWLLDWQGLPPRFGIFPYAADQVALYGAPRAGERVQCLVAVRYTAGIGTVADAFFTVGNRPIASVKGLRQRLIELPDALADRIFGTGTVRFSVPGTGGVRSIDLDEWRPALTRGGGIWSRALAHLILPPADLAQWRSGQDVEALLATILKAEMADGGVPVEIRREGSTLLGRASLRTPA
jgi:malonyl CoA-acyl carrier protein transacylase